MRGISSESLARTTAKPAHTGPEASPAHTSKPDLPAPRVAQANTTSHRFHFSNFRYSLTLFSKFFASFPHGTCSLSVSHQYLALDGIYHLLCAAFPNNATRRKRVVRATEQVHTGVSPSMLSSSKELTPNNRTDSASIDYNSPCQTGTEILSLSSSRFTRRY